MKAATILCALLLGAAASVPAQQAAPLANRFAATETPAERFDAGVLAVERHGQRGRPIILIPGLASGSWVWQEAIRRFRGEHAVYVVTLPGANGRAPIAGDVLQALRQLIAARGLDKPVLVGHGLGGTLALAVAQQEPGLVGGVATIDGLPVAPGTEDLAPDQRPQLADGILRKMAELTPQAFAIQQQQYMRSAGVVDMARADEIAKLMSASDPGAAVQYLAAQMARDLRSGLPAITAPVLVLAPFFDLDAPESNLDAKVGYYAELMAGTPRLQVVGIPGARHFAMIDQPQRVTEALQAFIGALK